MKFYMSSMFYILLCTYQKRGNRSAIVILIPCPNMHTGKGTGSDKIEMGACMCYCNDLAFACSALPHSSLCVLTSYYNQYRYYCYVYYYFYNLHPACRELACCSQLRLANRLGKIRCSFQMLTSKFEDNSGDSFNLSLRTQHAQAEKPGTARNHKGGEERVICLGTFIVVVCKETQSFEENSSVSRVSSPFQNSKLSKVKSENEE